MAGPLLLVHEDPSAIEALTRVLARQPDPVLVAGSADEAIRILGESAPGLVLVSSAIAGPILEVVGATPVLLLGAPVAEVSHPVAALPPDKDFLATVLELVRAADASASHAILESAQRALGRAREESSAQHRAIVAEVEELRRQARVDAAALAAEHEARQTAEAEGARLGDQLEAGDRALAQSLTSDAQMRDELARLSEEHRVLLTRRDALEASLNDELERSREGREVAAALELKRTERQRAAQRELDASRDAGTRLHRQLELERLERAAERTNAVARSEALAAELVALKAELETSTRETDRLRQELDRAKSARVAEEASTRTRTEAQLWTLQTELAAVKESGDRARRALELAKAEHADAVAGGEAHATQVAALQAELARADERIEVERAAASASIQSLRAGLEAEVSARALERKRAEQHRLEQLARFTAIEGQLAEAHQQLIAEADNAQAALDGARAEVAAGQDRAQAERYEHQARISSLEEQLAQTRRQLLDDAATASTALSAARDALHATRASRFAERARAHSESTELLARLATVEQQLKSERAAAASAIDALSAQRAAEQVRAQKAEALASQAQEQLRELQNRSALELKVEDAPITVPREGRVGLRELAELVMQLVRGRAEGRLELSCSRGTRALSLRHGALVAAESSLKSESLSERARRDGLIDERQNAQLQTLGSVPSWQLLDELLQRKLVRRDEVAGLLRRSAEDVALEALSETECSYRLLSPRSIRAEVDASIRPLPVLLTLGLRRAFTAESHLELLGGAQAVPRRTSAFDPRPFGFSPAERGLLEACDGQASVEALIAGAQLRPDGAWRVLSAARLLGQLELSIPARQQVSVSELEQLLEAKYQQVRQADYFTILGLSRSTDAAEVKRAHWLLLQQFEPLRGDAGLDAATHYRAKIVLAALEEAAHTLRDDRLRNAYARHLLD